MTTEVRTFEPATASEDELRAFYRHWIHYDAIFVPDDPPVPYEWYRAGWTTPIDSWAMVAWTVGDDGEVVASSGAFVDLRQNLENAECWVLVDEEHRGRGLGRALATALFDWLASNRRTRPSFRMPEGHEFASILGEAGAKDALRVRRSRLLVSDVDRALMDGWIGRAGERAGDYRIEFIETPVPEGSLERIAGIQEIMNEAPMEDFVRDEEHMSPEMWRNTERVLAARGDLLIHCVAVHERTGEWVGFTSLCYQSLDPVQAWVWNTGVAPEHRGKGLGRWVKAAMMIEVLDHYPGVGRLDTFNAGSNQAMLDINVAMGFHPLLVLINWQGDTSTMRDRLRL